MSEGRDKRKHERQELFVEIEYVCDSPVLKARISDISIGGIFIDTVNPLELGKTVKFRIRLPGTKGGKPITGEGVVAWRQETVGMGLRFTRMSREDWMTIRTFVQDLKIG